MMNKTPGFLSLIPPFVIDLILLRCCLDPNISLNVTYRTLYFLMWFFQSVYLAVSAILVCVGDDTSEDTHGLLLVQEASLFLTVLMGFANVIYYQRNSWLRHRAAQAELREDQRDENTAMLG
ncbi:hypothetical protein EDD21DRAFT_141667 [Dissophora ornata]|nr:hypothetical protein EDD21DRAFT_141667 [Dissophora ornata]